MLSPQQIKQFYEQGYVVVEGLVSAAACDHLRQEAEQLVAGFRPDEGLGTVFSTLSHKHDKDHYFLASDHNVSFFFEEEAYAKDGRLVVPHRQAINKIGHALHACHPVFKAFSQQKQVAAAVADLDFLTRPAIIQSMYIFKQPLIGGEVTCHQDATFIHTDPGRLLGVWFALEDATTSNGCLWGLPGAHSGPAQQLFIRQQEGCSFEPPKVAPWDLAELIPLEVNKGGVIFFHGYFPHMSYANRSPSSRHAFSLHLIDDDACYLDSNWIRKSPANCLPLQEQAP